MSIADTTKTHDAVSWTVMSGTQVRNSGEETIRITRLPRGAAVLIEAGESFMTRAIFCRGSADDCVLNELRVRKTLGSMGVLGEGSRQAFTVASDEFLSADLLSDGQCVPGQFLGGRPCRSVQGKRAEVAGIGGNTLDIPGFRVRYRHAAWHHLHTEVRSGPPAELWRYTAEMLSLLGNPSITTRSFRREPALCYSCLSTLQPT